MKKPATKSGKPSFFNLSREELESVLKENDLSTFISKQLFDWVYKKMNLNPESWTNISKKTKEFLLSNFDFSLPEIIWHGHSKDGTRKFLCQMADMNTVETVAIPSRDRLTLCVSCQVGCAMGCSFCHTGTQGLTRHLEAQEILGQFLAVSLWLKNNVHEEEKLTNIVYMGQGEPFHNFDNVKRSIEIFLDDCAFGLGQRRITVSTSGLVPKILKLSEFPPVNIAISLHSAKNDVRTELMPINKAFNVDKLLSAIKTIPLKAHRWITYEYLLIDGVNDDITDIEALTELLHKKESKVNLIPFNEFPGSKYKRPSPKKVVWFMEELNKRGLVATIRVTKGDDILAACGQLKTEYEKLNLWDNSIEIGQKTTKRLEDVLPSL